MAEFQENFIYRHQNLNFIESAQVTEWLSFSSCSPHSPHQSFKNVKAIFSLQPVQKHSVDWIWPAGSLQVPGLTNTCKHFIHKQITLPHP